MKLDHRHNRHENVRKGLAKFINATGEAGSGANLCIELLTGQQSGFIAEEQGRLANKWGDTFKCHPAALCNSTRRDRVIKIYQDFAKIKHDNFRGGHGYNRVSFVIKSEPFGHLTAF